MEDILKKVKFRLGILYDDPIKDEELKFMISVAREDMKKSGISDENIESDLGVATIILNLKLQESGVSNIWSLYIANIAKLRY